MCEDVQWAGLPHKDSGLAPLGDSALNACLHLLFHVPKFVKVLEESPHSCVNIECVFCHLVRIWGAYAHGRINIDLNSALCKIIPDPQIFETLMFLISMVHHDLANEENIDDSPILQIFGGELRTETACLKCGAVSCQKEQLLCVQLSVHHNDVQQSILDVVGGKKGVCEDCGKHSGKYTFKEISEGPRFLLLHLVSANENCSTLSLKVNETIQLPKGLVTTSTQGYKVIGAILSNRMAIVRCPNGNLVSLQDRKAKSFSWAKFLSRETGSTCKILIYQRLLKEPTTF
ncbi:Ubiquitin carboxyl-terminal hydrolase 36 [Frankliniella fusca]|uniref:Ubiquitin carboxyl-terminal hydrolase 36 n=1 Tax=Frankliniella fusca TaxID=407009 RepID=A0AAE1HB34_9NEOP|nr:Ubiquitin carboxyl-terminal hydrolase 36 [Frankliniella fusca]